MSPNVVKPVARSVLGQSGFIAELFEDGVVGRDHQPGSHFDVPCSFTDEVG